MACFSDRHKYTLAKMQSVVAGRLQLLAAALLFSTGGAAIKATSLTSWQVAGFRSVTAAVALLVLVPASRQAWSLRASIAGAAYAGTLLLFVLANKLTTAANAIFLQDTAPLYLLLLGPWLLKEKIRRSDILLLLVLAAGMAMFFVGGHPPSLTAPDPATGNVLALLSGVFWALTLAGLRWVELASGGRSSGMCSVVIGNFLAALIALPRAFPVVSAGLADWLTIAYLGIFQVGLAYVFLTRAIRRTPAFEASLLLLAEPAMNPVWAWLLHGERPGGPAIVGGALILGATVARALRAPDA
jgi:drug/metabolite transporter (DMT)-like permease